MRFCPSCGRPLPEGLVVHCPSCGAAIPAAMNEAERLSRDAEQVAGDAAAAAKALGDQFEAIGGDPSTPAPAQPPAVQGQGLEDADMTRIAGSPSAAPQTNTAAEAAAPPVMPQYGQPPVPPQQPAPPQ